MLDVYAKVLDVVQTIILQHLCLDGVNVFKNIVVESDLISEHIPSENFLRMFFASSCQWWITKFANSFDIVELKNFFAWR